MDKIPIPLWHYSTGYRRFTSRWWKRVFGWIATGWMFDIQTYWHRAKYGWAPRDTWNLAHYLSGAIGGSLAYLSECTNGAPGGYPNQHPRTMDEETDFKKWEEDLKRWGAAFTNYAKNDYYELHGSKKGYQDWHADEKARSLALKQALEEMTPWFEALWN